MTEIQEGIYLETVSAKIGTGGTAKDQRLDNYYLAKNIGEGMVEVRLLDMDYEPINMVEEVGLEEFNRRFTFKSDVVKEKKSFGDQKVDKAIAQAEAHYKRKEFFSAEFEYSKALALDEDNVRANFGQGKVFLAQGETDKAKEVFEKLTHIEAVYEEKNKHVFNELGIELRRQGLYDQAIAYYIKALSLAENDENLFFNAARAHFEKGGMKSARYYLEKALSLNPSLEEARRLLESIEKQAAT
ncbi:MAG: tetratricopeptide repeat protein [Thermodesulfobacteriota bacterium]|nr:tetratricopeptide repeat protein [Thermodesulfobacteriota bacterium]